MTKQKKVTINHYLNKQLKPKEANGLLYYAPYTRVTFDRKNNKFSMDWAKDFDISLDIKPFYNRFTDEGFTSFLQKHPGYVMEIDRTIEQSIRYEYHFFGDDFQLKGFGDRFELYRTLLYALFYDKIREDLFQELKKHLSKVELMEIGRAFNMPIFTRDSLQIKDHDLRKYQSILSKNSFGDISMCYVLSTYQVETERETGSRLATIFDWVVNDLKPDFEAYFNQTLSKKGWQLSTEVLEKVDLFINQALSEVY
ncbi:hypothetical protein [Phaeodactylibacter sp.]|jgi:hypothetical protein|uniref:hypothetical protein n=1 Tax=Phaeodactylibacter sp. TaxID=1940289 RepID=UPI0025EAB6E8|nr:hypothetical protein [Phaeodactylibacter sp.]MCI4649777.1 hypothetical protein [Phaeodactylibacter sp.]MCI5092976.1 hypothetical protein [Phaeodactylibacter sp.]